MGTSWFSLQPRAIRRPYDRQISYNLEKQYWEEVWRTQALLYCFKLPQNAVILPHFSRKRKPTFITSIKPSHINTSLSRPNGGQDQKFLKSNSAFTVLDMYKVQKSQRRNKYSLQVRRCTIDKSFVLTIYRKHSVQTDDPP